MGQPLSAATAHKNTAVTTARFMEIRVASNVPETRDMHTAKDFAAKCATMLSFQPLLPS